MKIDTSDYVILICLDQVMMASKHDEGIYGTIEQCFFLSFAVYNKFRLLIGMF